MRSILAVYDIPKTLKIKNPSSVLRRYGFRINLSCWVFPHNNTPVEVLDNLRSAGGIVHMLEFAEKDWDKVLRLAKDALQKHAKTVMEFVKNRCSALRDSPTHPDYPDSINWMSNEDQQKFYRRWRSILAKGQRELLAAQNCALGFSLTHDVSEALDGLYSVLRAELNLALAWKEENKAAAKVPA